MNQSVFKLTASTILLNNNFKVIACFWQIEIYKHIFFTKINEETK